MRPTVFLVHGFNVWDEGRGTIWKLAPLFSAHKFTPILFKYGWVGLIGVRLWTRKFARGLAELVKPGDIAVGHSNGANIINRAATEFGAPFSVVAYINPALDSDMPLAPQVDSALVYYTPRDVPVRLASLLWWHDWGDMGAIGYTGNDPRYISINTRERGHSTIFDNPKQLRWVVAGILYEHARHSNQNLTQPAV